MTVKFSLDGKPVGKGRPRFTRNRKPYTPQTTKDFENAIANAYKNQCNYNFGDAAIALVVYAYYPIPKSASKKARQNMLVGNKPPTVKPDIDNVVKCICDALNKVAYNDDNQIVCMLAMKKYSECPGIEVAIKSIDSGDGNDDEQRKDNQNSNI